MIRLVTGAKGSTSVSFTTLMSFFRLATISGGNASEDRLAVLSDAAVDDHEMGDALRDAVGEQGRDQAAEAVAHQHDVAQILFLERRDRVGQEQVVVAKGRKLGGPLADATKGQGAGLVARRPQLFDHELPGTRRPSRAPGRQIKLRMQPMS